MENNGTSYNYSSASSSPHSDRFIKDMEKDSTPEPVITRPSRFRFHLGGVKPRIYYWPIRTLVQFGFFLLFVGLALMRLSPFFNGTRGWVILPVLASVKGEYSITSTVDSMTLLFREGVFPWLPIGIMLVVGAILGRFMCGWICPFGFIQDVITSIKGHVVSVERRTQNNWVRLKYVLLALALLVSGTLALAVYYGVGSDYKASLGPFADGVFIAITPDGTLFGAIPVFLADFWKMTTTGQASQFSNLTSALGGVSVLIWINVLILIGALYAAWRIPRFWCRYICPVGAIMAVFQKNSLLGMHRDPVKCSDCKECQDACPMQVPILDLDWKKFNDSECILCFACIDACPAGALSPKFP